MVVLEKASLRIHAPIPAFANNDMVKQLYSHESSGFFQLLRYFSIFKRRLKIPAWMVVSNDDLSCSILNGFRKRASELETILVLAKIRKADPS